MQLFAEITESMATRLGFVAERAKRDKKSTFDNLMHLINEESLKASYQQLRKECAVGVDWFYFCSTKNDSLWMIFIAHCRFRKFGPGAAKVLTEDARVIYNTFHNNLKDFYKKHNLSNSEFALLSKELAEYFVSHKLPSISL